MGRHESPPARISSNSHNRSDPVLGGLVFQQRTILWTVERRQRTLVHFFSGNSGGTQEGYPDTYLMLNPSYGSAKNTLVVGRMGLIPTDLQLGGGRREMAGSSPIWFSQIVATTENHTYQRRMGSVQWRVLQACFTTFSLKWSQIVPCSRPMPLTTGNPGPSFRR